MSHDEADATTHHIEGKAFVAAFASADDNGIEILQIYSKEISKCMLDAIKSRSTSGPTPNNIIATSNVDPTPTTSEEISSIKTK
ncbi:MFP1 attachment factor 1 [Camellia lanceoleosa]|uniref:MFP1 attachment factor 1 n=1 Tax=Camellia lanceoleosa TaxID=1840588 RepID=A0ACC0IPP1_9ERIC|nr:MFP1 attachment factor 1 [Camellia lanceoleosa]